MIIEILTYDRHAKFAGRTMLSISWAIYIWIFEKIISYIYEANLTKY